MQPIVRVLVVGLGHMGMSHARAYSRLGGFEIAGLCTRNILGRLDLPPELAELPRFDNYGDALSTLEPDAVSINTWGDTHAEYALMAFEAGAHVFLEKPLAETVEDCQRVAAKAKATGKKLVVGYILRHHPSWTRFVELARTLGSPLVMRMNLNQQSVGEDWDWHKALMRSASPIVDCGVHYVDIMCLVTGAKPVKVHAIGARLTEEIAVDMYNYGQLQVSFDDGSVGWYEAGWGPMMSEEAFFVKDIIGPKGCVSIVMGSDEGQRSADMETHTKTSRIRLHYSELNTEGKLARRDQMIDLQDEPGHDQLCELEQGYFYEAITQDLDLSEHMADAINSLRIVLAADRSVRTGKIVQL